MKLDLSDSERKNLRKHKIRIAELYEYSVDEIQDILDISDERARLIYALADFQRIPSIGIKFAEDLVFLGYYSIEELRGKDGALLTDAYEKKKRYKTDPCVEDQFRLAVDYAVTQNKSKRWWDFTDERKAYRKDTGYPKDRPTVNWHELDETDR